MRIRGNEGKCFFWGTQGIAQFRLQPPPLMTFWWKKKQRLLVERDLHVQSPFCTNRKLCVYTNMCVFFAHTATQQQPRPFWYLFRLKKKSAAIVFVFCLACFWYVSCFLRACMICVICVCIRAHFCNVSRYWRARMICVICVCICVYLICIALLICVALFARAYNLRFLCMYLCMYICMYLCLRLCLRVYFSAFLMRAG